MNNLQSGLGLRLGHDRVVAFRTRKPFIPLLLLISLICLVNGEDPICTLDSSDRHWICDNCAKQSNCRETYAIVSHSECSTNDYERFNIMYLLLLEQIPNIDKPRYAFTGSGSCNLGATIAMSLNSVYGTVCASNERPQLNAAQTHIFCICQDTYCEVEYTDTVLNVLLLCIILLLVGHILLNIKRVVTASASVLLPSSSQKWVFRNRTPGY